MNLLNDERIKSNRVQVSGYLSPIEWDADDNPQKFSLYTEGGEDIILENLNTKKLIRKFKGKKLNAYGKCYKDQFGDKHLIVAKIKRDLDQPELLAS